MEPVKSFRVKMVKCLLDIIALKYMRDNGKLAGYKFLSWIQEKYGVLLSSGTIYARIYSFERKGLVKGEQGEKKRVYKLTKKGEAHLNAVLADPTAEQFLTLLEKP